VSRGARAGIAVGAAAGVAGLAFGAPRVVAKRLRKRPDNGASRVLNAPLYESATIPSHDGGTIHVVTAGSGAPIVLSHGVTLSVRTWIRQLETLPAQGFRIVAFDHRGHGESTVGDSGFSIDNLGDDIRSVVERLDLRDAVLVGHSMGGIAVQSFLIRHPEVAAERVKGVVLLSTLARVPLSGARAKGLRTFIDRVGTLAPDSTRLWGSPNLGFVVARVGFGRDAKPSHVELVRRMMFECAADTRRESPRSLLGLDLTARLPEVRIPTLVIGGSADVIAPPAESRRIAKLIPGARLEIVAGGGHMLMLERTELIDQLITDFAREVGAVAAAKPSAARG
jgi:pimeloyl-ACP methyl ester carboxylesterase